MSETTYTHIAFHSVVYMLYKQQVPSVLLHHTFRLLWQQGTEVNIVENLNASLCGAIA